MSGLRSDGEHTCRSIFEIELFRVPGGELTGAWPSLDLLRLNPSLLKIRLRRPIGAWVRLALLRFVLDLRRAFLGAVGTKSIASKLLGIVSK